MICIIGKMAEIDPVQAYANLQHMEDQLHILGIKVINPLKLGISSKWSSKQKLDKIAEVISDRAEGVLFLENWSRCPEAREIFMRVSKMNSKRPCKMVYYEDRKGFSQIQSDIHDHILRTSVIPNHN